jgi:hypothetical protein
MTMKKAGMTKKRAEMTKKRAEMTKRGLVHGIFKFHSAGSIGSCLKALAVGWLAETIG